MRIHPDVLSGKRKWQFPAALFLLALTVFAFGFFSVKDNRAVATQSNQITKLQIVVLKTNLQAGHELLKEDLGLEVRSIESIPEGALTQVEEGIGKYLAGNVHAGTVIAAAMLRGEAGHLEEKRLETATSSKGIVPSSESPAKTDPGEIIQESRQRSPSEIHPASVRAHARIQRIHELELSRATPPPEVAQEHLSISQAEEKKLVPEDSEENSTILKTAPEKLQVSAKDSKE